MLRLLADENFNNDIVRGLLLKNPELAIVRAQDVGLSNVDDPRVLEWCVENDRILLTHDRATMPGFAYERVVAGKNLMGLFIMSDRLPVGRAINEILLMDSCSEQTEWRGLVVYLPL